MKKFQLAIFFAAIVLTVVAYVYEFTNRHLERQQATPVSAPTPGFNQVIVGVTDAGKQVPILVDTTGAAILSTTGLSGASFSGYTETVAGVTDGGVPTPLLVDTSGGLILSGGNPPSIGYGTDCSMTTTTCTVTTNFGTASSHCFFSQTSGVLATLPCECASGTKSCVITCGATTTGTFSCLLIN